MMQYTGVEIISKSNIGLFRCTLNIKSMLPKPSEMGPPYERTLLSEEWERKAE